MQVCDWLQKSDDDGNWRPRRKGQKTRDDEVDAEDDGMSVNMSEMKVDDAAWGRRRRKPYSYCRLGPRQALSGERGKNDFWCGLLHCQDEVECGDECGLGLMAGVMERVRVGVMDRAPSN